MLLFKAVTTIWAARKHFIDFISSTKCHHSSSIASLIYIIYQVNNHNRQVKFIGFKIFQQIVFSIRVNFIYELMVRFNACLRGKFQITIFAYIFLQLKVELAASPDFFNHRIFSLICLVCLNV